MNKLLQGDALEVLKTLDSESVDCCITSPPYWALRDYGVVGQLGLEPTFQEYITKLCDIFDEVRRVLKKTGTCWVNLGDSYNNSSWANKESRLDKRRYNLNTMECGRGGQTNYPDKCLCQIPARFSIEMCNRGWILRNTIIWHKPNCMPSSVKDRFTVDFEYVFFFVKEKKYWFETQYETFLTQENRPHGIVRNREYEYQGKYKITKQDQLGKATYTGFNHRYSQPEQGRNKRSVWRITTKPFKEAHFAVFPEELVETPIRAGCPKGGTILDCFCGSGTTGVVAKRLNRQFIGIELNGEYIKMAEKRIANTMESLF